MAGWIQAAMQQNTIVAIIFHVGSKKLGKKVMKNGFKLSNTYTENKRKVKKIQDSNS